MTGWYKVSLEEELARNPQLSRDSIAELVQWKASQPHLPQVPELDLVHILHACNYNIEEAKKTIDYYYTLRSSLSFFKNRDPFSQGLQSSRKAVEILYIKNENNEIVSIGRTTNPDPSLYNPDEFLKNTSMLLDVCVRELGTVSGVVIVLDMQNTTLRHMLKLTPSLMANVFSYLQDGINLKTKKIHVINTKGSLLDILMAIIRPFLKRSLLEVMEFHSGHEILIDIIPKKYLPKEYGGEVLSFNEIADDCQHKLEAYKKFFEEESKVIVDEQKRPVQQRKKIFGIF